jgi:foldase protein PrsA
VVRVRRRLPVLLLLTAVVLAGCSGGDPRPSEAALVNGKPISVDEVTRRVADTRAGIAGSTASTQPGQQTQPDGVTLTRRILSDLIRTQLVVAAAAADGIQVTPAQIDKRLDEIRTRVEAQGQKLEEAVAGEGLTIETLRDQLRLDAAASGIAGRLVPDPTAAQIQAELTKRKTEPRSLKARHILVADEATARKVRAELEAGGDWKALAAQYSTDPGSKPNGGDLGELTKGQTVPEFDTSLFQLAGQGNCKGAKAACASPLSQPVKTQFGWHVLQVTGVTRLSGAEAKALTADAVKAELTSQLQPKRQQAFSDWLRELAVDSEVKVNPRFGVWQAESASITDRDTAPQPPPTSTPTIQLGDQPVDGQGGQAPAAP